MQHPLGDIVCTLKGPIPYEVPLEDTVPLAVFGPSIVTPQEGSNTSRDYSTPNPLEISINFRLEAFMGLAKWPRVLPR